VFALKRPNGEGAPEKDRKNPLDALLGRKTPDPDEALPEVDVVAGLRRILRTMPKQTSSGPAEDLDPVRGALAAIEAALYAVDAVREIIEQAYEVALSAQDVEDAGGRALLAESYDELRLSIDKSIEELDERAALLLGGGQRNLDVRLGGKAHYSVSPVRLDSSAKGLNLRPPREAFSTFEEINEVLAELDGALKKADRTAAAYCRDAQFLIARISQQ